MDHARILGGSRANRVLRILLHVVTASLTFCACEAAKREREESAHVCMYVWVWVREGKDENFLRCARLVER